MTKWVYFFGGGKAEGKKDMKELLGGKGANLAEMTNAKLPVPPGMTITTEACIYYSDNKKWPAGLEKQIKANIKNIEKVTKKEFGSVENPLLVSVRSGARVSMPGMMDTVLNLGLNDESVIGLANKTGNERMAYDSYRRFINMFGDVVMGVSHEHFEHEMDKLKREVGARQDTDLSTEDLKELCKRYEAVYKKHTGKPFPQDPMKQLEAAINAVFKSWNGKRAIAYRRINNIPNDWGTAVNVQTMVFGNMGDTSGTGVAFTRNPATGEKEYYGECLINAQGEDVVAGIRTPQPIESLEENMPKAYSELLQVYHKLEKHYKDVQDFEFTIEEGKLYILQTRNGKRTAQAAVKIAVDMCNEKLVTRDQSILMVDPEQLNHLLHKRIDPDAKVDVIAKGLPASPGAARGKVVFTAEDAVEWSHERDEKVILVRIETSPEDIEGMDVAEGILTAKGGMTSHAAVVARGMGKPCVAGCEDISINYDAKRFTVAGVTVSEGDTITLNGATGEVIQGDVELIEPEISGEFKTFMTWVDKIRALKVRTNADTPKDSVVARDFGAEGIGLCRTEHMFFEGDRIKAVRRMILSEDLEGRKKALDKLLPMQQGDFEGIFKAMDGLPVTIRLLDPPLHEFLPSAHKDIVALAGEMGVSVEKLEAKVKSLHELNPMLGHRGCRLAISYPEICEMQARAIFEATVAVKKKGVNVKPEVMIPLIGDVNELKVLKKIVVEVADDVMKKHKARFSYMVGTMIEIPRAALTADKVAEEAEFFSFGTNDLTQMTFGYSRDDVGKFVPMYVDSGILERDPFQVLDQTGVGQLVEMGVKRGRTARPNLKVGICGEHGGEPNSVEFCHKVGMDYVSCSPYRVPIARLAAAQAQIKKPRKTGKKAAAKKKASKRSAAKKVKKKKKTAKKAKKKK
ncbi:MAG: pyruvate, phosphate dikinase [Candidatus Altiarchaeales archaeon]|nr:pyruvate, phosphate dikinase [Candidatus Altiarchaeales archaeon]MBD3416226.1 pyruvate, phosphate dikinase [Candidatus Altiarchaeales archaeon]